MTKIPQRNRKSEKLTPSEQRALKKYVASFPTVIDAAYAIGVHRNTLDLIIIKGGGSPETINLIRQKVESKEAA